MEIKVKVDGTVEPGAITAKLDAELSKAQKVDEFRKSHKLARIDYQDSTLTYTSIADQPAANPDPKPDVKPTPAPKSGSKIKPTEKK